MTINKQDNKSVINSMGVDERPVIIWSGAWEKWCTDNNIGDEKILDYYSLNKTNGFITKEQCPYLLTEILHDAMVNNLLVEAEIFSSKTKVVRINDYKRYKITLAYNRNIKKGNNWKYHVFSLVDIVTGKTISKFPVHVENELVPYFGWMSNTVTTERINFGCHPLWIINQLLSKAYKDRC